MLINKKRKPNAPNLIDSRSRRHSGNDDIESVVSSRSSGSQSSRSSNGTRSVSGSESGSSGSSRGRKNKHHNRDIDELSDISGSDVSSESSASRTERSGSEDYDGSETNSETTVATREERPKSYEEIQKEKQDLLYKLERMEKNGAKLSRVYTMASNIEDIRMEYMKLKRQTDVDRSIKKSRNIMMMSVRGLEMVTKMFKIPVHLDGWSEECWENLADYDDVFERLHDKYSDKINLPPELELLMMLGGSAFMFHVSNSLFKSSSIPNIDEILRQNPDIMRSVANAAVHSLQNQNNPMANMMAAGVNMSATAAGASAMPMMPPRPMPTPATASSGMNPFAAFEGRNVVPPSATQQSRPMEVPLREMPVIPPTQRSPMQTQATMPPSQMQTQQRQQQPRVMKGPSGVDDILRNLSNTAMNTSAQAPPRPTMPMRGKATTGAKPNNTITIDL
jgi:hypothetical protein